MPEYTPAGFSAWMANGGGNYIDPTFHTAGLGFAGIHDGSTHAAAPTFGNGPALDPC